MASLLCFLVVLASLTTATALRNPLRRRFNNIPQKAATTPEDARVLAEAATPAGRAKLADVKKVLSDKSFISSVTSALPSFGGEATAEELAEIASARAALPDDTWLASRTDAELLPFARCNNADGLAARLAETSEWRSRIIPDASDDSWEFANFFEANKDKMFVNEELGERPFMEWVPARDTDDASSAPTQLDGASLLILRPGRHNVGAIDSDTWLKLIAWHGERATTTWAREAAERGDGGTAGVALIVDRRGSGLRNQDPALLRALLPALTKNFPYSLHTAYVAPINVVFYAIWAVARLVLPKAVTARFTLLTGDGYADRLRERLGPDVAARLNAVESKWAGQCVVDECLEPL